MPFPIVEHQVDDLAPLAFVKEKRPSKLISPQALPTSNPLIADEKSHSTSAKPTNSEYFFGNASSRQEDKISAVQESELFKSPSPTKQRSFNTEAVIGDSDDGDSSMNGKSSNPSLQRSNAKGGRASRDSRRSTVGTHRAQRSSAVYRDLSLDMLNFNDIPEEPMERYRQLCTVMEVIRKADEKRVEILKGKGVNEVGEAILDWATHIGKEVSRAFKDIVIKIATDMSRDPSALETARLRFNVFCHEVPNWLNMRDELDLDKRDHTNKRQLIQIRTFLSVFYLSTANLASLLAEASDFCTVEEIPGWKLEFGSLELRLYRERSNEIGEGTYIQELLNNQDAQNTDEIGEPKKKDKLAKLKRKESKEKDNPIDLMAQLKEEYGADQFLWDVRFGGNEGLEISSIDNSNYDSQALSKPWRTPLTLSMDRFDFRSQIYQKLFAHREHRNYFGDVDKLGETVISIRREKLPFRKGNASSNHLSSSPLTIAETYGFRILIRTRALPNDIIHLVISDKQLILATTVRGFFGGSGSPLGQSLPMSTSLSEISEKVWKALLNLLIPKVEYNKLRRIDVIEGGDFSKLEKAITQLDGHRTSFSYKFGVLLIRDGQMNESEWFANRAEHFKDEYDQPHSFTAFCQNIGTIIELKGHQGFSAGLDTKNNNTGQYSIYNKWLYDPSRRAAVSSPPADLSFEIMFHVSTMLPYIENDEQQIQRKRHIGNDLVSIIFLEKSDDELVRVHTRFNPSLIKSQFLHVYIVVQPVKWPLISATGSQKTGSSQGSEAYHVRVISTSDIPSFSPYLPDPPIFMVSSEQEKQVFKDFLIAKLINAENAAYEAAKFKALQSRTHGALIEALVQEQLALPNADIKSGRNKSAENVTSSSLAKQGSVHEAVQKMERITASNDGLDEPDNNVFSQIKTAIARSKGLNRSAEELNSPSEKLKGRPARAVSHSNERAK